MKYGLSTRKERGRVIQEWRAHPAQSQVLAHPARFIVLPCGRRWGKSELMALKAAQWARQAGPRRPIWWVGPTYEACEPGLQAIEALWPPSWIARDGVSRSPGNMRVRTTWGVDVSFRSAEKERSLRGRGLGGLLMDECGEIPDHAWQILRPSLIDSQAPGMFGGTPKGRNWFYEVSQYDQDPQKHPRWKTFHFTSYANPLLPRDELLSLHDTMGERYYRQEILAEFIMDSGGVFHDPRGCAHGRAWQRGHLPGLLAHDAQDQPYEPKPGEQHVLAWDVARDTDWSVITIDHANTRRTVYWDRFAKIPYPAQVKRVVAAARHFNATVIMDSTGPGDGVMDFLAEALQGTGLQFVPFKFTHASKQNLIDNHAILVAQRATTWPDIPRITNEHEVYEWKSAGRSGAPDSGKVTNDDCVISKALATWLSGHLQAAEASTGVIDLGLIGRGRTDTDKPRRVA